MPDAASHLNPPRQARSRRTLERMVRAGLEILEREGADALTVQAVVERAGSSVGSFYARFAGKDDLLDYLGERVWREAATRWDEALAGHEWSGLTLEEAIDGAVRLLSDQGRSRASLLEVLGAAPGARTDAHAAFHTHVIGGLESLLLERAGEMDHPDPAVAVALGLRAALSVLEAPPAHGAGEPLPLERRVEEAARLLRAYLVGGRGGRGHPGDVDFFEVWS